MPKQNKKRGRRSERKRQPETELEESENKRQKQDEEVVQNEAAFEDNPDYIPFEDAERSNEKPFYGMLDEQEIEYFHKAGEMVEMNQFPEPEDRDDFVRTVYTQLAGKELKVAFTQGTSRTLERIIQLSNSSQLKQLFKAFTEQRVVSQVYRYQTDRLVSSISSHIASLLTAASPSLPNPLP
jgi:nucleolar protein 9